MKATLKHITLGTLVFLLFSQMSSKKNEFVGKYRFNTGFGNIFLDLKFNHKFISETIGCYQVKRKGKWIVENSDVILFFDNKKWPIKSDTLKIKILDSKIDSLGNYKKL